VLTEQDRSPVFARLTHRDRRNILEILLATKTGLPDEWHRYDKHSGRPRPNLACQQNDTHARNSPITQALNQTPKGIVP
jgi:hypothetical protein